MRPLRSLAAIESVCIGVHPWLKEFRGRHLHPVQAQRRDVAHPFAREPGHGAGAGAGLPSARRHGMAAACESEDQEAEHHTPALCPERRGRRVPGPSGFCFPQAQTGGVRGRLFLARLSAARDEATEQRGLLAEEICPQQGTRSACDYTSHGHRLSFFELLKV